MSPFFPEQVKADLKGQQLSRCLFVGDAGMVSEAKLKTLSRAGGKYILERLVGEARGGRGLRAILVVLLDRAPVAVVLAASRFGSNGAELQDRIE